MILEMDPRQREPNDSADGCKGKKVAVMGRLGQGAHGLGVSGMRNTLWREFPAISPHPAVGKY